MKTSIAILGLTVFSSLAQATDYGLPQCSVFIVNRGAMLPAVDLIQPKYKKDLAKNNFQKGHYLYEYSYKGFEFTISVLDFAQWKNPPETRKDDTGEFIHTATISKGSLDTTQSVYEGDRVVLNLGDKVIRGTLICQPQGKATL